MPQGGPERRLATVLFLDIVGSTSIASDIADHRWRELLARFRRIVRSQLKSGGGREENFTGDGVLATFQEPVKAIRTGTAIAEAVHELGVEVRCGIHTGECERIEGSLGGIAVHIASRVMSLAGPAEVLVTSTVKELVTGSGIGFEDFSAHELKGVPGTWQLLAVQSVDGNPVGKPLTAEDAAGRIAAVEPAPFLRRRRRMLVGGGLLLAAAIAVPLILLIAGGDGGGTTRPTNLGTVTLVKVDPATDEIVTVLRDDYYSHHLPGSLTSEGGALWQYTGTEIVRRDFATGRPELTIRLGSPLRAGDLAFGSVWTATQVGAEDTMITRYDEVTGRPGKKFSLGDVRLASLSGGNGAMWALGIDGELLKIDPLKNKVVETYDTKTFAPGVAVALDGYVWICDCEAGRVIQFDPRKGERVRTLKLAERGYLVDVDSDHGSTLWLLDPTGSTLTPIDPKTGEAGQPLGFGGQLGEAKIGFGALWVAAQSSIYRINLDTKDRQTIRMPKGSSAGSIGLDEKSGAVWVGNCGCLEG